MEDKRKWDAAARAAGVLGVFSSRCIAPENPPRRRNMGSNGNLAETSRFDAVDRIDCDDGNGLIAGDTTSGRSGDAPSAGDIAVNAFQSGSRCEGANGCTALLIDEICDEGI